MKTIRITLGLLAGLFSLVLVSRAGGQKQGDAQANGAMPSSLSVPKTKKAMDVSLSAEEIALARSLRGGPPWGIPDRYAPGPERQLVERKMQLWAEERIKAIREQRERMSPLPPEVVERRKIWERATRMGEAVPGSRAKPVPYVLEEDLPADERKRFHEDLLRIHQMEQERLAKDGPSKTLLAIVGECPLDQLKHIYSVLLETAIEAAPQVKAMGYGTMRHRVAYVRQELENMAIRLTDEQIEQLIAVKPVQQLWTKD